MKNIKYLILGHSDVFNPVTREIEKKEVFAKVSRPYSEANEEVAKHEAYNGEYVIEDDGKPDPAEQPTQLDRIEAQVAYNSIMLGTLMEV